MKKQLPLILMLAALIPVAASAQAPSLQNSLSGFMGFVNNTLIPFLFGMAVLFFIINVIRYFVIGGSNQDGQEAAKNLATYGVAAFVFLLIFWGIINLIVNSTGLGADTCTQPSSDYYDGTAPPDCW